MHKVVKKSWLAFPTVLLFSALASSAQEVRTDSQMPQVHQYADSPALGEMAPLEPSARIRPMIPWRRAPRPTFTPLQQPKTVEQTVTGPSVSTTDLLNFDGIGDRDRVAPSDSNAAVGATQVVETVNTSGQVFDKKTGASLFGPAELNTLWSGVGGLCQTGLQTDPVVLYDKMAGRWVITELAFNDAFTTFMECIAVSTSSNAVSSYHRYSIDFGSGSVVPDYPKIAVWPDAYYMSFNLFLFGVLFTGPQVCALDRIAMLAGNPATVQCFLLPVTDASLLPSDLDGATAPPSGEPNFFFELGTSTTLNLFKFHVDFTAPANTTLTGPISIPVSFYTDACPASGTCIPQAGTSQLLDAVGDRLMHRLAYRNFGDHEALVATHSVNTSTGAAGIRWYEIRDPNGAPFVIQQSTLAMGTTSLWMASIAMDKNGDIAVGASVSSSSLHPSIGYTGRVPSDPLGTMETAKIIIFGSGSQTGGLSRWGDYTSMSIDPVDDCTFWYTNEYLKSSGSFNWSTRLASFKFSSCQ